MASKASTPASADEQPKQDVAKKVITSNRHYFFPQHGLSVLAETMKEAEAKIKALTGTKRKRAAKSASSAASVTKPADTAPAESTEPAPTASEPQTPPAEPTQTEGGDDSSVTGAANG